MSEPHHDRRTAILQLLGSGPVAYYPALAAIAGGVTAGVLLAQLFYWHDKGWDPDGWIYKTQAEWEAETGLTRREQETARRTLKDQGVLEEKLAGMPARLHYRLDVDRVIELLAEHRQTRLAGSANQDWRNPPNKFGAERQTSMAESAKHTENTRDHHRQHRAQSTAAVGSRKILCSLHGAPMTLRRKNGATWYSHRLPDGSWCQGGPSDQPDDRVDPLSWAHRREYATQFGWDVSLTAPSAGDPDDGAVDPPPQPRDPPRARPPNRSQGSANAANRSPPEGSATLDAGHGPAPGANPGCGSDLLSDLPVPPAAASDDKRRSGGSVTPTGRSPPEGSAALDASHPRGRGRRVER